MKRKLLLFVIILFTVNITFSETTELLNSEITATTTNFLPGTTVDLQFHLDWVTTDYEWIDGISLDFPAGVTVNSATDIDGEPTNGETGDGVLVTWGDMTGGSGWGPISQDDDFTVNVTIDAGFTGDMNIDWLIVGDEYGSPPHSASGSMAIVNDAVVPISNWALYLGILLMVIFIVSRFRRMKLA